MLLVSSNSEVLDSLNSLHSAEQPARAERCVAKEERLLCSVMCVSSAHCDRP